MEIDLICHVIRRVPYRFDVVFEGFRDSLGMLRVLFGDNGQVADLVAVVLRQVSK